ncbi:MAG: response regulator, partial [Mariprofundus sp.]
FTIELPFERPIQTAEPQDLSQVHLLLLGDQPDENATEQLLERWGTQVSCITDEKLLLSSLLDAWSMGQPYDVVMIDKAALQCKPERLARAVRDTPDLVGLDMILIDPGEDKTYDPALVASGYSSVLHLPLQQSLLFNVLHAASVAHHSADVISSADMLQKKELLKPVNILLAEDNLVNQEVISEILKKAGHHVHLVEDGEQALGALTSDADFDLVLLDLNMPKVSGLDVLKQFRFMDTSAKTPVLMLSADALPETIRACMEAGASDYLTKPVQISSLLEKVAEFSDIGEPQEASRNTSESETEYDTELDHVVLDELFGLILSTEKRKQFLHSFVSSGEQHLDALDDCARRGDKAQFFDRLHNLKGSAAVLGVQCLAHLCAKIEGQRQSLDAVSMTAYVKELRNSFHMGHTALHAYLQQ